MTDSSKALGSVPEVNHGVVHRNNVFLPGEASQPCSVWFQPTGKDGAALAAMPALCSEESAESIVVVSEPQQTLLEQILDRENMKQAWAQVKEYVEDRLKLLVNQDKSKVAPLGECSFLGFNVRGKQIRCTEKAAKRFKRRIQQITSRSRGVSMKRRLVELKRYCIGWFHYFKIGLPYKEVREWDGWIRRRIRLCYWKDWKLPRKRRRMLIMLGIPREEVKKASRSRKGYPPLLCELWRGGAGGCHRTAWSGWP